MSKTKTLLESYFNGIRYQSSGESYLTILKYLFPELITALILHSILNLIDAHFIAHLKSTSLYATQGMTSTLIHFLTKAIEGLSVGTIILCGQYNGKHDYNNVGRAAISALWVTFWVGLVIMFFLYGYAEEIYRFYNLPEKMVVAGAQFLRWRALGIFFACMYFALIGFLRGIKNTQIPMQLFLVGGIVFLCCDYIFIFGKLGFPALKLQGSAIASVMQYGVMLFGAILYIIFDRDTKKYRVDIIRGGDFQHMKTILNLSWPVMLDKATLAAEKIWLTYLVAPMGKTVLASFTVIKDMELFAFVPAIACAQVITFLVSNDYSTGNWEGIKTNIKRVVFIASIMVFAILLLFSLWPQYIIALFDKKGVFIEFASLAFPLVSLLVFFDVLQLLLSAALRGAAEVKTVMMVRVIIGIFFFIPFSYGIFCLPIENNVIKFSMIYGSFYIGNAIMSIIYIQRFRGNAWKRQVVIKDCA